ncbi:MAG: 3-phosphoshikimate 1-carboxyvinyltransferase [Clostridiales bacterium]|nr:3-phosphoshikimate 1-carboxyvinyltransferase [Clostridiales bacterium]
MKAVFSPSKAVGTVKAPPSKSMGHRLLIAAALAEGESRIDNAAKSEDILATVDCLRAVGASLTWEGDSLLVKGFDPTKRKAVLSASCRESGSTLRFFLPIALLSETEATLFGAGRLLKRPMDIYAEICRERGLAFMQTEERITVKGPLCAGVYTMPGNVSSQFVSGLLFALPLLSGDSRICLSTAVESRSYIDMTLSALASFGVKAHWEGERELFIPGGQRYRASHAVIEGDHSNAAFLSAFDLVGGSVTVTGLLADSLQGDRVYKKAFEAIRAGEAFSIADCPDLGPILMAAAANCGGGRLLDTARLRIKESDRGAAMAAELQKLGVTALVEENTITVSGILKPPSEPLFGHNDHRIVMSLSVLLSALGGEIEGAEAVKKSYPDFFRDIAALGIEVTVA